MKKIWQGLLAAIIIIWGAILSPMPSSVWSEIHAAERPSLVDHNGETGECDAKITPLPGDARQSSAASKSDETMVIANAAGPIALGAEPALISLSPAPTNIAQRETLTSHVDSLGPDRHLYLVLKELRATKQPGILYHLYLDLASDAKPAKNDPHYVGTLNFYNAVVSGVSGAPTSKNSSFRSFDITAVVRNLQARKLLSDPTTVTIFPSGVGVSDAQPVIGRIELVVQ